MNNVVNNVVNGIPGDNMPGGNGLKGGLEDALGPMQDLSLIHI